jgi:Rrf2 family iron-sulfur cluster assembly transcriptional regulator
MRISTKGHHAVMAMTDIARKGAGKPVSLAEVAERQGISLSYLEQLVAKLKKKGLLKSARGPGGGYMLGLPQEEISVADIVNAVDNSAPCESVADKDSASGRQLADLLWHAVGDAITEYLKKVSLADVCNCTFCPDGKFKNKNFG